MFGVRHITSLNWSSQCGPWDTSSRKWLDLAPKKTEASNYDQTEDVTDAELESLSPEASGCCDPPSPPGGDDNSHDKELHPPESTPPAEYHGDFMILDEGLRAKVRMIADGETLESLWHVVNYVDARSSLWLDTVVLDHTIYLKHLLLQSWMKEPGYSGINLFKRKERKGRSSV